MRQYFGTDGIRGVANKELTPELAMSLGKAVCQVVDEESEKVMLIGSDTRRSCEMLKSALMAGITSMGYDVIDLGVIPTPGICYLMDFYNASAGFVISASHNSEEYNGIKVFGKNGYKLSDEEELTIEKLIDEPKGEVLSNKNLGVISIDEEGKDLYKKYLIDLFELDLSGMKIILDCANGATFEIAPDIYESQGALMNLIGVSPDGTNINDGVGSTYPEILRERVKKEKASAGFAYDGDGDRLIVVDEKGNIMNGDHIIAALAYYFKKTNQLKNNTVVGTVMSNMGLGEFSEKHDIHFVETSVGDRYIQEQMIKNNYSVGGEQSGHIILKDYINTGDGILASLALLKACQDLDMTLSELNDLMVSYPQILVNVKVNEKFKSNYENLEEYKEKLRDLENSFGKNGRVLIRPSGTEPVIRVMIEGEDVDLMEEKANEFARFLEGLSEA